MEKTRKERVVLSFEERENLRRDYKNGTPITALCTKYNISTASVYRYRGDNERKERVVLSFEERENLKEDYKNGTPILRLAEKYSVSSSTVEACLAEEDYSSYDDNNAVKEKFKKKKRRMSAKEKREERKKMKKELGKKYNVVVNMENITTSNEAAEEKVVNDDTISIGNGIYELSIFDLNKVQQLDVNAGLVADRHCMPNIDLYIFESIDPEDLMFDYAKQYDICKKFINKNVSSSQTLNCYCTGLQSPLASLIKACIDTNTSLTLKHYDTEIKVYRNQTIIDNNNSKNFCFNRLLTKGELYTYKDSISDFKENTEAACISINEHYQDDRTFKSSIHILVSKDNMWEAYSKLYKIIEDDANSDVLLSLMMANLQITDGDCKWGDNICKSYNFK